MYDSDEVEEALAAAGVCEVQATWALIVLELKDPTHAKVTEAMLARGFTQDQLDKEGFDDISNL